MQKIQIQIQKIQIQIQRNTDRNTNVITNMRA